MEIEELKRQRDSAMAQVDELRRKLQEDLQVCPRFVSPLNPFFLSLSGSNKPFFSMHSVESNTSSIT